MKFLIVGRTASGKDHLKEILQARYGWKFVKSYTTRAKRTPDEDTHIFISHEEAQAIPASEKVAITKICNQNEIPDEYFATRKQVQEADAYIIDPIGVKILLSNMPDECFEIIYVQAEMDAMRKAAAIDRASDKEKAEKNFDKRNADEDAQFTEFEQTFESGAFGAQNCQQLTVYRNNYQDNWAEQSAFRINVLKSLYRKLNPMIDGLLAQQTLETNDEGKILITKQIPSDDTKDESYRYMEVPFTKEQLIQSLYTDNEGLSTLFLEWLAMPTTKLTNDNQVQTSNSTSMNDCISDVIQKLKESGDYPELQPYSVAELTEKVCNTLLEPK